MNPTGYGRIAFDFKPLAMLLALLVAVAAHQAPTPASAAQGERPITIVALGDSLTAGYNLASEEAFPAVLQRALRDRGHAVEIHNAGVSGDTATAALSRLDWALPEDADAVIVELGANDALRGTDPAATRADLDRLLTRLGDRELPVLLAGMLAPPNMGRDYAERFNAIFPDLAERHDAVFYPFFLDGVAAERDLNQADGMHPTAAGVERIVERILPAVEQLIERVRARRAA